ncbi:MAG TPA: hypothetical protein VF540_01285, partial [Segetibacter sp.]
SKTFTPDAFQPLPDGTPSPAMLLADRSYEYGEVIGIKNRQRGNSVQKDAYVIAQVGVSFNISSYRCPKPKVSNVECSRRIQMIKATFTTFVL